jgi:DNA polymerase elongation subunit (family B)
MLKKRQEGNVKREKSRALRQIQLLSSERASLADWEAQAPPLPESLHSPLSSVPEALRTAYLRRAAHEELGSEALRGCTYAFQVFGVNVLDSPPDDRELSDDEDDDGDDDDDGRRRGGRSAFRGGDATAYVFGVDADGNSVMLRVEGFRPHFFLDVDVDNNNSRATTAQKRAEAMLAKVGLRVDDTRIKVASLAARKLGGYVPPRTTDTTEGRVFDFAKISSNSVTGMKSAAKKLRKQFGVRVCEDRVSVAHKFKESFRGRSGEELSPCGWIGVAGDFLDHVSPADRLSWCDVELVCKESDTLSLHGIDRLAPLMVASYDIECMSPTYEFPNENIEDNRVVVVGTTYRRVGIFPTRKGAPEIGGTRRTSHVLGTCGPVEGVAVHSHGTETELLNAWREEIAEEYRPDCLTGYNVWGFDNKYMFRRACMSPPDDDMFSRLSKFKFECVKLTEKDLSSSAMGDNKMYHLHCAGRFTIDMFHWIKTRFSDLKSLSLDDVSRNFLGGGEDDAKIALAYSRITDAFLAPTDDATLEERTRVVDYCARDCDLPLRLIERLSTLQEVTEMARVCHTPVVDVLTRGQQIRVYSHLLVVAHRRQYVLNDMPRRTAVIGGVPFPAGEYPAGELRKMRRRGGCWGAVKLPHGWSASFYTEDDFKGKEITISQSTTDAERMLPKRVTSVRVERPKYAGATVLEPKTGYYNEFPVVTLDYSSLYPSIILSGNLCFSTHVHDGVEVPPHVDVTEYEIEPGRVIRFVSAQSQRGVLGEMLEALLDARRRCRKKLKSIEKGSPLWRLLDGRQLAFKVLCNSCYGYCGSSTGDYADEDIAKTITFTGRNMIEETKAFMERNYEAEVIYGDTDSVMVIFPSKYKSDDDESKLVEEAFAKGEEAALAMTKKLDNANELECEKASIPYLLFGKKTYCARTFEDPKGPPKLDMKGLVAVRRDAPDIVSNLMRTVLDSLIMRRNVDAALGDVHACMDLLVRSKVPTSDLVLSRRLSGSYKSTNLPQTMVAAKMEKRNPGSAPKSGDRIKFVIVEHANPKAKICEKAEDVEYAVENALPIDRIHYLDHLIARPVGQLFSPFLEDTDALFRGARNIIQLQNSKQTTLVGMTKDSNGFSLVPPPPSLENYNPDAVRRKRANTTTSQEPPRRKVAKQCTLFDCL